jgi:mRNA interferase RelE/StbE
MNISYSKIFEKKFATYPKNLQQKIFTAINLIPEGDIKKMTGNNIPPIYRLRVSKYRILFHMTSTEIKVLKVDSRGDVYK